MDVFRVFPWDGVSRGAKPGGPLHVSRHLQGSGRHGCPDKYGVLYCSRGQVSAIAESIHIFRGKIIGDANLRREGRRLALVHLSLDRDADIPDLDDPGSLVRRRLRPSRVATGDRPTTQALAAALFEEGVRGFLWWSTLEARWINLSLFWERVRDTISVAGSPEFLTTARPELRTAAEILGVNVR